MLNRFVPGALIVGVGVLIDGAAALLILAGQVVGGMLLHVPAALIWAAGVNVLLGPGRPSAATSPNESDDDGTTPSNDEAGNPVSVNVRNVTRLDRRTPLIVLGMLLFPGVGLAGGSVALCISPLLPRARLPRRLRTESSPETGPLLPPSDPVDLLGELEARPLVELLQDPEARVRRASIRDLAGQVGPESEALVRALLRDPDLEVRTFAAVVLTQIEDRLGRALVEAAVRVKEEPSVAERYIDLARLYRQYAARTSLDDGSRLRYLGLACQALERATELEPERDAGWLELARTQFELGKTMLAWQAINRVIRRNPKDVDGYLLGMEMAFHEGQFTRLVKLARRGSQIGAIDRDQARLLDWWAGAATSGAVSQ